MGKEFDYSSEAVEQRLEFVEALFTKYGAEPLDIDESNREKFGQRRLFKYNDSFYRVDEMKFEEDDKPFIILSCTDDEKYANIGLLEDIDALDFGDSDEKLEKAIRYAFGIEPYPDDYSSSGI